MYLFRASPEPADFETLAAHIGTATMSTMHPSLWLRRDKIIKRLRVVASRGAVEEAERAIYHAMRLLIYG